ncbi:MAG: 3'(2'),5'-bisphosphate nucleotidase CysQ [Sphingomonas sp.]|nr:3'(2'),5'-bisphosphate nucleotidase CysQ [Sphingomonas sp.]
MSDLAADAVLAEAIAREAGGLLRSIMADATCPPAELGRRGDKEANALILTRLRAARPGDFILSEEAEDDKARCAARRVWIIDPLDGTRDYADRLGDYAVHVGLAVDGVPVVGAVTLPASGVTFSSLHPPALPPMPARTPRIVISRTRPPAVADAVAKALGGVLVPMGSAGFKAMAVLSGDAEIYLHTGGQYEWDNCAPAAVAIAAGLHASRIDGTPLAYNCADPLLPDVLICRAEWAAPTLAAIAASVTA